eukprot:Sspe_Gene.89224::Locus_61039_Transcript_7_8_Confidence_0.650_Length_924::g.89224::m.89224
MPIALDPLGEDLVLQQCCDGHSPREGSDPKAGGATLPVGEYLLRLTPVGAVGGPACISFSIIAVRSLQACFLADSFPSRISRSCAARRAFMAFEQRKSSHTLSVGTGTCSRIIPAVMRFTIRLDALSRRAARPLSTLDKGGEVSTLDWDGPEMGRIPDLRCSSAIWY